MSGKVKNWYKEQSKQAKIILVATLVLHLAIAAYKTPFYLLPQYGVGIFLGRLSGQFLGVMIPLLLGSAIIALIFYLTFRSFAEKYKKYLDYLAIIFLIVSIVILYFGTFYRPY